jgi:hypothetical protein
MEFLAEDWEYGHRRLFLETDKRIINLISLSVRSVAEPGAVYLELRSKPLSHANGVLND